MKSKEQAMQRMKSKQFRITSDLYQKLLCEVNYLARGLDKSKYHYLEKKDVFHDTLEITINYLSEYDSPTETNFVKLFWANFKLMMRRGFDKRNPRAVEPKLRANLEEYMHPKTTMPDLDTTRLMSRVSNNYPTISKVISGYSFAEAGREEGISTSGYRQRYEKEMSNLRKSL